MKSCGSMKDGIPDVSVVMSVYNNRETLPKALDSVLSQKDVDLELIVVDDGSTDGSAACLDEYASADSRIRCLHQANTGLTRALIRGCSMARAPYIARQDADDLSLPHRLSSQLRCAHASKDAVLIACGSQCVYGRESVLEYRSVPESPTAIRKKIIEEGRAVCPHGALMFLRQAYQDVGGYREAFYYAQDIDLILRLAERGECVAVPEELYQYSVDPNTISGRSTYAQKAFYEFALQCRDLRNRGEREQEVIEQAEQRTRDLVENPHRHQDTFTGYYLLGCRLMPKHPSEAQRLFRKAITCRPVSIKAWCRWMQTVWAIMRTGAARI